MSEVDIPLVDLRSAGADPELREAVERVMTSTRFILGPEVASFEQAFAAYCGTRYAVGVGSGTAALHIALHSLGIGAGTALSRSRTRSTPRLKPSTKLART